jgi:chemotaxis protein MotB
VNGDGSAMLITLGQELGSLPNKLSIEGHTDSTPYAPSATYGNWELSADRANAARRVMSPRSQDRPGNTNQGNAPQDLPVIWWMPD